MNFNVFRDRLFQHYMGGEYRAALRLLDEQAGNFPDHAVRILYWQACVQALAGQPDAAIHSLRELIEHGWWYNPEAVRGDDDLKSLHDRVEFEQVLQTFAERQASAQLAAHPDLKVFEPDPRAAQPYPLLLAIHGRNSNNGSFADLWSPLTRQGWLVGVPQSSLILASDSYGWDDREQAVVELRAHFDHICQQYPIDPQRIVLSGFSQGGGLSIWLTLTQEIPASGFLAVCPYLHGVKELDVRPGVGPVRVPGIMITGERDPNQAMFTHLERLLKNAGIDFERRHYPELGHDIPADFEAVLPAALASLTGSRLH